MTSNTEVYRIDYQTLGIDDLEKSLRSLDGIDNIIKKLKKELSSADIKTDKFDALNRAIAETKVQRNAIVAQQKAVEKALVEPAQFAEGSYRQLNAQLIQTKNRYKDLSESERNSPFGKQLLSDIGTLDTRLKGIDATMGQYQRNVGNYKNQIIGSLSQISPNLGNLAQGISGVTGAAGGLSALSSGLAVAVPLAVGAATKTLNINALISDLKADVRKTANLTQDDVDGLVESLKALDTRTSLQDLLKISAIGGQFGIEGSENVLRFSSAIDKLNVALGDEFGGSAETVTKEIGGLSNIFFGATKDGVQLEKNLLTLGNAINQLSAEGSATAPVLSDFSSRIGRIGIPLGLTQGQVLGMSAALQELNVNAEQGGTGVQRLLTAITSDRDNIAKTLGLDVKQFTELLNKDLFGAFNMVIGRVGELSKSNTDLSDIMKALKIDGQGELSVFLSLANNQDLLKKRTDLATESLKGRQSILDEFGVKNGNLAASVDKLGNAFDEAFVSSGAEKALKGILDGITAAIGPTFDFAAAVFKTLTFYKEIQAISAVVSLPNQKLQQDTNAAINAQTLSQQFRSGKNLLFDFRDTLKGEENKATKAITSPLAKFSVLDKDKKPLNSTERENFDKEKPKSPKPKKKDPSVKAAEDVADELADIEKESAKRIESIRKEAAKARVAAIADDYTREVESEKSRLGERILTIREAGQKIEANAIEQAEKLKGKKGISQKQIDEILLKGKNERLKIEQESNDLYRLEFEQHRQKIAEIDDKYHQKYLEGLDKKAQEQAKKVKSDLDAELLLVENAADEAQRANEKSRRAALVGKNEEEKRQINISFDDKAGDIENDRLTKRLEIFQKLAVAIQLVNTASKNGGFADVVDPSVLTGIFEQITTTERQITAAQIEENERRDKNDADTTERRLERQRSMRDQLTQIAFDGAQNIVSNAFQLETIEAQAASEARTRAVEKEYAEKLKAAQGNATLTAQLEQELQDKKNAIEADSIREQAEINKTQAVIDAGLAILKTFTSVPFPASLLAAGFIGVQAAQQVSIINAQTDRQLAALKGEQGLVVPLDSGRFEIGKDITGKRHSQGGELAMLNGQLVEAEAGERLDKDENGNLYVINRRSTEKFKSRLNQIAGRTFEGKGRELSLINQAGGGIPLARLGFSTQSNLPGTSAVNSGKLEITLSDAAIDSLANTIAAKTGQAVEVGAMNGIDTANRSRERQALAANSAII